MKGVKYFFLLLACFILLFVCAQWVNLSNRNSGIDELTALLTDATPLLSHTQRLRFETNAPEPEKNELVFQSQFVMAPILLLQRNTCCDTILVIDRTNGIPTLITGTEILWEKGQEKYTARLLVTK
jgi:hypothetical protein